MAGNPGELTPEQVKQGALLAHYERQYAQRHQRLAACMAAVTDAEQAAMQLRNSHGLRLLNAVDMQSGRLTTLQVEIGLYEDEEIGAGNATGNGDQTDTLSYTDQVLALLATQDEEIAELARQLKEGWSGLTESRRERVIQERSTGPDLKPRQASYRLRHLTAIGHQSDRIDGKMRELRALRLAHSQALLEVVAQLDDLLRGLRERLGGVVWEADEIDTGRPDVLEAKVTSITEVQRSLYRLVEEQFQQIAQADQTVRTARAEQLELQVWQEDLRLTIEGMKPLV